MAEKQDYFYSKSTETIYVKTEPDRYDGYPRNPKLSCRNECEGCWECGYGLDDDEAADEELYNSSMDACQSENMDEYGCPYEESEEVRFGELNWQMDEDPEECGFCGEYPIYVGLFSSLSECRESLSEHGL